MPHRQRYAYTRLSALDTSANHDGSETIGVSNRVTMLRRAISRFQAVCASRREPSSASPARIRAGSIMHGRTPDKDAQAGGLAIPISSDLSRTTLMSITLSSPAESLAKGRGEAQVWITRMEIARNRHIRVKLRRGSPMASGLRAVPVTRGERRGHHVEAEDEGR